MHFINKAKDVNIKIISSIKPEGYIVGSDVFKLKIVFKHKYVDAVEFHGVDLSGAKKVLLNGVKALTFHPSVSPADYRDVYITSDPPYNSNYFYFSSTQILFLLYIFQIIINNFQIINNIARRNPAGIFYLFKFSLLARYGRPICRYTDFCEIYLIVFDVMIINSQISLMAVFCLFLFFTHY